MKGLRIDTTSHDDVVVATLIGEIDLLNHEEVSQDLFAAALDGGPRLVVDLNAVDYVDSNGVRMLFALARELEHSRIEWAVALADDAALRRLFEVTTFDEVARMHPSVDAAVSAVRAAK